jgi:hypothetical protein
MVVAFLFLAGSLAPSLSRTMHSSAFVASAPLFEASGSTASAAPQRPVVGEGSIGRESFPTVTKQSGIEGATTAAEEVEAGVDDSLFLNPKKASRLLSTMRKIEEGKLREPTAHAEKCGLKIEEEEDERPQEKSLLSKLYRKWRIESKKPRTVEEVYPDEASEKQRKRLVRKTMTQILNLAAQKQYQEERAQIEERRKTPLPAPPGLKSLGWKGDAQFKVPEAMKQTAAAGSSKGKRPNAARPKPVQKRSPKDEAIKLFGELLRDKEFVRRVEAKMRDKNNSLRQIQRVENRHARKVERAIFAEVQGDEQTNAPGLEALRGGYDAASLRLPPRSCSHNLALRGGAGIPTW